MKEKVVTSQDLVWTVKYYCIPTVNDITYDL